ncbi:lactate utilization protein B/C [Subsaximicrobium wynnwilliamsii]|uniref:Lactate utilization protein B/C n=1 Tax=Subsaximicrobium wynnwilliamsii TaxID=291179 RepID=A0A5C6ZFJ3_9FLAO|nr:LUD domain-containing protein [Subsaximicrobium wynnwilliamsii]TXD82356.1 lactate utilization protein B/C [Subsaximicrobium wynnwilliamsii]TXD87994.1 lactate utilization protein B/C [Subsaximicrobium wynnwilliamsii]TXE01987.1 lactate utilization protein B/C [Subsaximicrobium wynnwilliamsii]
MSLFRKIFGLKNTPEETIKNEERGKYMPEVKLPIDEQFTINFKANGGKFLYCENMQEIQQNLKFILSENNWQNEKVFIYDEQLNQLFKAMDFDATKKVSESTYFFSTCEYLIADDGSLLISSNQIAEKKLKELPDHLIIFATTSQFVQNIGEGLRGIKHKSKQNSKIPTNITTIKHFKTIEDKDFLSYGSSSKNLYLLLLEDL